MKAVLVVLSLALIASINASASTYEDLRTWGGMKGKVGRVNTDDYLFSSTEKSATLKYSGKKGAKSFGAPGVVFDAAPFHGKKLKFSAEIKTLESKGSSLWMRVDGQQKMYAFDNGLSRKLVGQQNWTQFEVVLPISENAEQVLAGLLHFSKGEVSIRNVNFSVTDEPITAIEIYKTTYTLDVKQWRMAEGQASLYNTHLSNDSVTLKSNSPEVSKKDYAIWMENFDPKPFIGQRLMFSAELRSDKVVDGYAGLYMRVDGKGDARKFYNMKDRPITGTTDWTTYSVVLDIKDETVFNLAFGMVLANSGEVSIRNPTLTTVGKSIPEDEMPYIETSSVQQNLPCQFNLNFFEFKFEREC